MRDADTRNRVYIVLGLLLLAAIIATSVTIWRTYEDLTEKEAQRQSFFRIWTCSYIDSDFYKELTFEDRTDERGNAYVAVKFSTELDAVFGELVENYNADPETEAFISENEARLGLTDGLTVSAKRMYYDREDPLLQFLKWTSEEARLVAVERTGFNAVGSAFRFEMTNYDYLVSDSDFMNNYHYVWEFLATEPWDAQTEIGQIFALADYDLFKGITLEEQIDDQGNQYYCAVPSDKLNEHLYTLVRTYYIDPSTPKNIYENSEYYPPQSMQEVSGSTPPSSYSYTEERYKKLIYYLTEGISTALTNPELKSQLEDFMAWTKRPADLVYSHESKNSTRPIAAGDPVENPPSYYDFIRRGESSTEDYRFRAAFDIVEGRGILRSVTLGVKYHQDASSYYVGVPDDELRAVLDELVTLYNDEYYEIDDEEGEEPLTSEEVLYCFTEGWEEQARIKHNAKEPTIWNPRSATQFLTFIRWTDSSAPLKYLHDVVHEDGTVGKEGERVRDLYAPNLYDYITNKDSYPDYVYEVE